MSQKRKSFTVEEKCRIIRMLEKGKRNADIQKELGVSASTIATIWKSREYFKGLLNLNCKNVKRRRKCSNMEIEKMLLDWIKETEAQENYTERIKISALQLKANELALQKGIDFTFTKSWIQRFRVRNGFSTTSYNETIYESDYLQGHNVFDPGLKCRLCLVECTENKAIPLFKNNIASNLIELISKYLNIKLTDNDEYSTVVCPKCARQLNLFHDFSQNIEQCQHILKKVQNSSTFSACLEEMDTTFEDPVDIKTEQLEDLTDFEIQDLPDEFNCNSLEETEDTIYSAQHTIEEDPISNTMKVEKPPNKFWEKKNIEENEDNTCDICHIVLKNVPTLITHYQHMHKNYKDFKYYSCKVCGLQFSKERSFQHHLTKSKKCAVIMEPS